eukprot:tig00021179_g19286.t1
MRLELTAAVQHVKGFGSLSTKAGSRSAHTREKPVCGDGRRDAGEECGERNHEEGSGCAPDCTKIEAFCGNGIKEGDEACDRGRSNGMPGERCTSECEVPRGCGCNCLSSITGEAGEGKPLSEAALKDLSMLKMAVSTRALSENSRCGDGVLDKGEQCGEANKEEGSGCAPDCTVVDTFCGNGIREDGEECDLGRGNGMPGERCTSDCQTPHDCGCLCLDAIGAAPEKKPEVRHRELKAKPKPKPVEEEEEEEAEEDDFAYPPKADAAPRVWKPSTQTDFDGYTYSGSAGAEEADGIFERLLDSEVLATEEGGAAGEGAEAGEELEAELAEEELWL